MFELIETVLLDWLFVLIIGFVFYKFVYDGTEKMQSTVDNKIYSVRRGHDKQLRADILELKKFISELPQKEAPHANEYIDLIKILSGKKARIFAGSLITADGGYGTSIK